MNNYCVNNALNLRKIIFYRYLTKKKAIFGLSCIITKDNRRSVVCHKVILNLQVCKNKQVHHVCIRNLFPHLL